MTDPSKLNQNSAADGRIPAADEETRLAHTMLMQLLIDEARGGDGIPEHELIAHLAGTESKSLPARNALPAREATKESRWAS